MSRLLSALMRLLLSLIFAVVGIFVFSQLGWPYLISLTQPEAAVTIDGPCRSGVNESERLCGGSWTLSGAETSGEVRGVDLRTGTSVSAHVDGDRALVVPPAGTLALYCVPLLFVLVAPLILFTGRLRFSRGSDDGWDFGDSDGGGDGGGGGD
ncbi:hypothetical protein [Catenuloplanes japonicus]|uniref:hypothetical protein n=1 Tax=Catenuloplanes japonicus TaxID=33876 RepID=UPI0005270F41|nr:hypothetical protein [Catenuloplanes japonicus]